MTVLVWASSPSIGIAIAQERPPEAAAAPDGRDSAQADDQASGGDELSPEELAELEAALGQDAEDAATSRPPAPGPSSVASALQSMNPDISLIVDSAIAYFSDEDNLQTGGHDPTSTGFNLQQLEMAIGKEVDPYFRLDGNLVFSQFGVEIEEIYATTLNLPWNVQARIGQFLTQIGRINPTHPHSWDFVDQPFAIGRLFGAEGNRGVGVELSYLTPLPWYVEIIASATDAAGEATARSFFGSQDLPVESPLDVQSSLVIKQFFGLSDDLSALWGLSVATGPNATGHDNRSDVYATDLYLKYRPITRQSYTTVALQTEWFYRRRQIPNSLLSDLSGYLYLYWRFARRWSTAWRAEYGEPANTRKGEFEGDYLDPDWSDYRVRGSASLTFWPTEFSRVRAQGAVDVPFWRNDPIYALFLAFEFNIGAHGAHKF